MNSFQSHAAEVDSAVALSLTRVIFKALRETSPEMAIRLEVCLKSEIDKRLFEAELHHDKIAEATAAILAQTLEQ